MRTLIAVTAFCLLGAAPQEAQSPPSTPQRPPVFRSGVDLVTVDVTVVDRDGKPVTGLTPDDFAVTIDGQRRGVRALDYLEFGAASTATSASTHSTNQGPLASQSRGGRVILLVVDDLSAKPTQMTDLRTAAQRMLATLDLGDLVGVVTTSGLGPVVNLTRDRAAVKEALESKLIMGRYDEGAPQVYVSIPEAIDINRNVSHSFAPDRGYNLDIQTTFARVVRRECFDLVADPQMQGGKDISDGLCTQRIIGAARQLAKTLVTRAAAQLAAYAHYIDVLATAPAPRVIIALSAGVPLGVDQGTPAELEPVSLAAAKAGVQLYALTEVQDSTDVTEMGFDRPTARREEDAFLMSGVQTVAEAAGGEAFKVVGQADRFFQRIVKETSGMYQLGVEAPLSSTNAFVNVKVAVNRPGLSIRTKAHALSPSSKPSTRPAPPSGSGSIEDGLRARLAQGGSSFGVPIELTTAIRREPLAARQLQLGVNVQIPASVPGPVLTMFAVVDDQGRIIQQGRKQLPQPAAGQEYQVVLPVPIDPGAYRLRVAAADANGNVGSLEHPVTATLPQFGAWTVSDLSTTWSGPDGVPHFLALETFPNSATTLRVSLELYPDDARAPSTVKVRLAVIAAGETAPFVWRDVAPTDTGATRTVSASLPADQLAAGEYTIRATLLESGVITGEVSTVVRKKSPDFLTPRDGG